MFIPDNIVNCTLLRLSSMCLTLIYFRPTTNSHLYVFLCGYCVVYSVSVVAWHTRPAQRRKNKPRGMTVMVVRYQYRQ